MDFLFLLAPFGVIIGSIIITANKRSKIANYNQIFSEIATKYQCTFVKGNFFYFPKFFGTIDGIKLRVENTDDNQNETLKFTLKYAPTYSGSFLIEKESTLSSLKKAVGIEDIQTGDKDFDDIMLISSSHPSLINALFSKPEREKIISLAEKTTGFMVGENSIAISSYLNNYKRAEDFINIIELLLSIAKNILYGTDIRDRLLENLNIETKPEVLINTIKALTSQYSLDREITNNLKDMLSNTSIAVQVEAAQHLGARGMEHIAVILKEKKYHNVSLEMKIIEILGNHKYEKSIPLLKNKFLETADSKKQIAILKTFEKIENSETEPFLLEQLESKKTDLLHTAIEALGTCGTVAAAEKLYILAKDSINPFTKNSAQKAIGQIQSRLGNVEKGWLSVSDSPEAEGALSFSDTSTEGALSIDTEDKN